jgi:hypothetical protein
MHRPVAEEVLNVGEVFGGDSHLFCQPITRALATPTRMADFVPVQDLNSGKATGKTTAADSCASSGRGN